jgi:glycosyltransferase involved in cell wall biosynthesis
VRPMPRDTPLDVDACSHVCAHVLDVELSEPVAGLERITPDGRWAERAWVLVRLFGEPLGLDVLEIPPAGLSGESLLEVELDRWLPRLSQILEVGGSEPRQETVRAALRTVEGTAFRRAHQEFILRAPRCSVVVCTRDRPQDLRRCLRSLAIQDYPDYAVWVVDNAPASRGTRQVVDSFAAEMNIRYIAEPRPGLSRARNAALGADLQSDWVAWLDDDEVADPMWLTELMRAFDGRTEVVAASGVVVPARLDTQAQIWFEQFGGHSKGRGFTADLFSQATRSRQHPLYPLPPFGVGANMAFRTETLRMLGGFDEALGAGTPSQGSEDTRMFTDILMRGGAIAYWPSAVTRHFHRRDMDGLRRQMRGYGSGLTAFYTAMVLARPSAAASLVRLTPRALRDVFSSDSLRVATLEDDFPRDLLAENRRGMVAGPWLYLRGKLQVWGTGR